MYFDTVDFMAHTYIYLQYTTLCIHVWNTKHHNCSAKMMVCVINNDKDILQL